MDRVSVRSFRASDLAERAIKDLARSRLDTGREVVFQPLGGRFLEVREDAARIVALLREDAFHAENGHFTRMTLRVDSQLADRLAGLEPRAVERRLEEATRDAILRELPRAQGVYLARFEPSARGGLEPVAHVHLSCRMSDGGPVPALTREETRRFEATWSRAAGPPLDLRDVEHRQVFDVVRVRIEGGERYFRGPLEAHRRTLLETAASRAADLPDERDRRLAVVAWPAGPGLQAAVYFNQRSRPERVPGSLDSERMRGALEARLADEIRRFAPSLDPTAEARAHELGRPEARLPERAPAKEHTAPVPERGRAPALQQGAPAIVVRLDRQHVREAEA